MECSDINTNELDEEKLESKILELTKPISYTIPDYVIASILNEKNIDNDPEDDTNERKDEKDDEKKRIII